eukprot:766900-Hanusia_phi.AAC.6
MKVATSSVFSAISRCLSSAVCCRLGQKTVLLPHRNLIFSMDQNLLDARGDIPAADSSAKDRAGRESPTLARKRSQCLRDFDASSSLSPDVAE